MISGDKTVGNSVKKADLGRGAIQRFISLCSGTFSGDLIAALGIILAFLLSFNKVIFFENTFWLTDIANMGAPFHRALASAISMRQVDPLIWNTFLFGGFPLFAEGEGGFLYLPNILAFAFLSPMDAGVLLTVLHAIFAGLSAYALARYLGASRKGSIIAAFAYPFGGTFVAYSAWLQALSSAAWLPLLLFWLEWGLRQRRLDCSIPLGFVWGIQLLAGHPQTSLFSLVALGIFACFRVVSMKMELRQVSFVVVLLALSVLIGLGLSSVQVLSTFELQSQTIRSGVSDDFAMIGSLSPLNLVSLVYPFFFLNPGLGVDWDTYGSNVWIYAGVAPLMLALLSFKVTKARYLVPTAAMTIVALGLTFGKNLPLYPMLRVVPGFNGFRFSSRFGLVFDLGIGLLAAFGLSGWSVAIQKKRLLLLAGGLCWVLGIVLALYFMVVSGPSSSKVTSVLRDIILSIGGNPVLSKELLTGWLVSTADMHLLWVISPLILLGVVGLILILGAWNTKVRSIVPAVMVVSTVVDLLFFSSLVRPILVTVPKSAVPGIPPVVQALPAEARQGRVYTSYGLAPVEDRLRPNQLMNYDVPTLHGYSPLLPVRHNAYFSVLMAASGKPQLAKLLGAAGVEFALFAPGEHDPSYVSPFVYRPMGTNALQTPFAEPDFVRIWTGEDGSIYRNERALPRARVVYSAIEASNMEGAIQIVSDTGFDPARQAVVEGHGGLNEGEYLGELPQVEWLRNDPLEIDLNVRTERPGVLVLADLYYPAWHVFVDGKEETIYPANVMFRGVFLGSGEHQIRFEFNSESLRAGTYISTGTLLLVLGWGILHIALWKRRNSRTGVQ